jgi:hypothetical protein
VIGAGTVINPIVKIVTTVVILGAVYLFIVRPVLDTTEKVVDQTAAQFERSQRDAAKQSAQMDLDLSKSRTSSFINSLQSGWPAAAREVKDCVRAAGNEPGSYTRCEELAETLVHTVQSDYNFATSYADSLASSGRAAEAERVRDCVDRADFRMGPMQRCRNLADRLLFG